MWFRITFYLLFSLESAEKSSIPGAQDHNFYPSEFSKRSFFTSSRLTPKADEISLETREKH